MSDSVYGISCLGVGVGREGVPFPGPGRDSVGEGGTLSWSRMAGTGWGKVVPCPGPG